MNDNPEINYRINLKEGDQGALKSLERYSKALEKARRDFNADSQVKIQKELNRLREIGADVVQREEQRQRAVTRELERQEQIRRSFSTQSAGDLSSGLSATRALTSTLGGGGALTGALELGDDAFQLIEYLPRLKDGLGQLAGSAAAAAGGVVPLVASLGAVGIALGAVALAFDAFNRSQQEQAQELKATLEARVQIARELAEGLTAEEARAAKERLDNQRAYLESELERQQAAYDQGVEQAGDAVTRLLFILSPAEEELSQSINNLRAEIEDLDKLSTRYQRTIENGATATNDAATAEERITEARKKTLDVIKQLEVQQTALLNNYRAQQKVLAENRALQDDRRAEDETVKAARAERDLNRALALEAQAQQKRLVAIAQQGSQRLIDLERATADRRAQVARQLTKLQADFERERVKAEERFNRDRERALRNQRASELDAIIENDITALILGRRQFGRSESDAREDFDLDRQERAEALRIRIEEINAELAEFQQAQAVKRTEIQAQTAAEIELAKQEYAEKQRLDAETREIRRRDEEEDRQRTRDRLEEDRRIEDRRAAEQLSKQMADIETKRIAEVRALGDVIAATGRVRQAAAEVMYMLSGRTGTPFNRHLSSSGTALSSPAPALPMSTPTNSYMSTPLPPPSMSGGMTVNISNNAFGNVATTETLQQVVKAIQSGIVIARSLG